MLYTAWTDSNNFIAEENRFILQDLTTLGGENQVQYSHHLDWEDNTPCPITPSPSIEKRFKNQGNEISGYYTNNTGQVNAYWTKSDHV